MPGLPKIGVQVVAENSDGYIKAMGAIQKANDQAAQSVQDTAKKFDVLNDTTDYARDVQKRYSESLKAARSALEDTTPKVDHFKEAIAAASLAVGAAQAIFGAVAKAISFVGEIIGSIIKKVADLGSAIFSNGLDFSKIMANISAVTKKTGTDIRDLGKELIAIGSDSVAGPMAVADAYYDIASGVQDAGTRMTILKQAIAESEAGQADLKATTQGLITVMNAYNYGIAETTVAADIFTRTTDLGTKTMNEYVAALSPIAGQAASNKIGFDELGAAMSFMTIKGLSAGQAGTALGGIMTQLARNTPGVNKALRAMGEESITSSIANNGLAGTLKLLSEGAKKTGQNLQTLVGRQEAMKAVTFLSTEEFKSFFKVYMDGLDEATSKSREIQRLDVGAQLKLIAARFEGIGLSISQAVLPAFGKFLKFVNDAFKKVDWKKIGEGLDKVGEKLGESVGKLAGKLGEMLATIDWDQLSTDVQNVFGQIADYIGTIDWGAVIKGVQDFVASVGNGITSIGDFFKGISDFAAGVQNAWNGLLNFVDVVGHGIGDILAAAIENGKAIIEGAVTHVKDGVNAIWLQLFGPEGDLTVAATNAWTAIQTAINNGKILIDTAILAIKTAVETTWNTFFGEGGTIQTTVTTAMLNVTNFINNALMPIQDAINQIVATAEAIWNGLFGEGGTLIEPVKTAFTTVITTVTNIKDSIARVFSAIGDAVSKGLAAAISALAHLLELVKQLASVAVPSWALNALGGGGGGGGVPGKAKGGKLEPGWNVVGEKGPELVYKSSGMEMVYASSASKGMIDNAVKTMQSGGGGGGASAKQTKGIVQSLLVGGSTGGGKSVHWGGGNNGNNVIAQAIRAIIPAVERDIRYLGHSVYANVATKANKGLVAKAMPLPVGNSTSNSNAVVNNNRNIEHVNFYGGRDTGSAVERFARLRMLRRV